MTEYYKRNLILLQEKIKSFALRYHRSFEDIQIMAASKFQPFESIKCFYDLGVRDFGENYIQEWQKKELQGRNIFPDLKWHFIGTLQSNKVKFLNSSLYCLQSLDRLELARAIEQRAPLDHRLKVLIQLKGEGNESKKSGARFEEGLALCDFVLQSKKMDLCGFMGIGPHVDEKDHLEKFYASFLKQAKQLWKEFFLETEKKPLLSLGMSLDLERAIASGSNMLRIGTALFGDRKLK
jgi:pyridoxal phosphate enzyme (YggS family)